MTTLTDIRAQAQWLEQLIARLKRKQMESDIQMAKQVLETVRCREGCIEAGESMIRLDLAGDEPKEVA